jgi:hypothetical protein
MPYFSTDPDGLGEFGCGADCSCKSCRSTAAANLGEVYEKEEIAPPASAKPPAAPKMGGWFGESPFPRPRAPVMPGQLRMRPFEVLTGYAPGEWRLNQAQLARIHRLAEHVVRTWTTRPPVTGIRLIGFAEPAEAQAGLQRAAAARAALTDAINQLNPGVLRAIKVSAEDGGPAPTSGGIVRRVEVLLWVGVGTRNASPVQPSPWSTPRIRVIRPVRIPTPAEVMRSASELQRFGEPRSLTVRAEFVIRTTTVANANLEPFKDGEIQIIIWEGAGTRILWPPKPQRKFIKASEANGVISSPPLSGIESDRIAIMALVRFGGTSGRTHQLTGLFPVPATDKFTLTVYVDLKAASVVVRAANDVSAQRKARAKLAQQARIIDKMIRSGGLVRPLDKGAEQNAPGKYKVELEHFTGTLGFDPRPEQILGRQ